MPIAFRDEKAVRWTVVAHRPAKDPDPSHTTLVFTSEGGELRICDGCLPDGATWDEVEDRAWCVLLHHAHVMPADVRPS